VRRLRVGQFLLVKPNKRPIDADKHKEIQDKSGISTKDTGIHGGKYNLRFQEEINGLGGYEGVTAQQVSHIADALMTEFGL
jgi:hypothetical protein